MDYYELLNLQNDCSIKDIKTSYKKMALLYHPDKNSNTEDKFKKIVEAYETLKDPMKRTSYDMSLRPNYFKEILLFVDFTLHSPTPDFKNFIKYLYEEHDYKIKDLKNMTNIYLKIWKKNKWCEKEITINLHQWLFGGNIVINHENINYNIKFKGYIETQNMYYKVDELNIYINFVVNLTVQDEKYLRKIFETKKMESNDYKTIFLN